MGAEAPECPVAGCERADQSDNPGPPSRARPRTMFDHGRKGGKRDGQFTDSAGPCQGVSTASPGRVTEAPSAAVEGVDLLTSLFISHSSQDRGVAERIRADLHSSGFAN